MQLRNTFEKYIWEIHLRNTLDKYTWEIQLRSTEVQCLDGTPDCMSAIYTHNAAPTPMLGNIIIFNRKRQVGQGLRCVCLESHRMMLIWFNFSPENRYFWKSSPLVKGATDNLGILLVKVLVHAIAAPRPRYQVENMILVQILLSQRHNTNTCHRIFSRNMFSVNSCCGTTMLNCQI